MNNYKRCKPEMNYCCTMKPPNGLRFSRCDRAQRSGVRWKRWLGGVWMGHRQRSRACVPTKRNAPCQTTPSPSPHCARVSMTTRCVSMRHQPRVQHSNVPFDGAPHNVLHELRREAPPAACFGSLPISLPRFASARPESRPDAARPPSANGQSRRAR